MSKKSSESGVIPKIVIKNRIDKLIKSPTSRLTITNKTEIRTIRIINKQTSHNMPQKGELYPITVAITEQNKNQRQCLIAENQIKPIDTNDKQDAIEYEIS